MTFRGLEVIEPKGAPILGEAARRSLTTIPLKSEENPIAIFVVER